jgi:hypothetical protein
MHDLRKTLAQKTKHFTFAERKHRVGSKNKMNGLHNHFFDKNF